MRMTFNEKYKLIEIKQAADQIAVEARHLASAAEKATAAYVYGKYLNTDIYVNRMLVLLTEIEEKTYRRKPNGKV